MSNRIHSTLYILILTVGSSCAQKSITSTNLGNVTSEINDQSTSMYFKQGYVLGADLGGVDKNVDVLFFDTTCIIIGLNGHPYSFVANPQFDPLKLPLNLQDEYYNAIAITLNLSFVSEEQQVKKFHAVPSWLKKVRTLEYLTVDYIKLDQSFFLEHLPIKHLVLKEILEEDKNVIISNLAELKNLQYLVHRFLFTPEEVLTIKEKSPRVTILLESEYESKIERGEISIPK